MVERRVQYQFDHLVLSSDVGNFVIVVVVNVLVNITIISSIRKRVRVRAECRRHYYMMTTVLVCILQFCTEITYGKPCVYLSGKKCMNKIHARNITGLFLTSTCVKSRKLNHAFQTINGVCPPIACHVIEDAINRN